MRRRRGLQPKSLFARFFLGFLFTLTATALAIILVMPRQLENLLVSSAERDMVNKIEKVRPSVLMYLSGQINYADIRTIVSTLESLLGGRIYIVDQTGTIRVTSPGFGNELLRKQISWDDYTNLQNGQRITRRESVPSAEDNENIKTLTIAMPINGERRTTQGTQQFFFGAIYLEVPVEALRATAQAARQQVAIMPLIVCSFAMLMSGIISRSLSHPLQRMNNAALRMARGEYSTRINEERDDELGQLGQSFNLMAVSLEVSIRTLQDERDRIRNLIHALTEGVIATDAALNILLINPAAAQYLQINIEEAAGRSLLGLPMHETLRELLTSASLVPQSSAVDINDQLVLAVTTSPLSDENGNLSAQIAILKDITESYRLEQQLKDFVANVSHELRTPLTSIRGFVEGMLDQTIPPEMNERYLNIIHQESIRLTRMIHELLDLSHIESGHLLLKPEPVELGPLLHSVLLQTRIGGQREDVRLEVDLSPPEPVLFADPDRLEQILINLLSNAIKFTPQGGLLTVRSFARCDDAEKIQIEIIDSGPGIAAEDLPYVWDRFFKADRSRSSTGTGLGLSIVRSLIEAHQETIWVENRPPHGACFCLTMPLLPDPDDEEPPEI